CERSRLMWVLVWCIAASLVVETEQLLRVVVKDFIGDRLGQPQPLDIGEGRSVALEILQHRIIAAGDEVILAKGFERAAERSLRAVTDRVVVEFLGGDALRLGEVRLVAL